MVEDCKRYLFNTDVNIQFVMSNGESDSCSCPIDECITLISSPYNSAGINQSYGLAYDHCPEHLRDRMIDISVSDEKKQNAYPSVVSFFSVQNTCS